MARSDELSVLMRSARQLAKLCRDSAALVAEARGENAPGSERVRPMTPATAHERASAIGTRLDELGRTVAVARRAPCRLRPGEDQGRSPGR
jgi:hypothetical protein